LAEARNEIIFRRDEKQQKKAEVYLKRLGVEILLNERITTLNTQDYETYHGSSGKVYSTKDYLVLMATGVKLNTSFIQTSTNEPSLDTCIDIYGAIRVKPTLQVEHWEYNHIFAGGDATNVVEEKTAYAATIAGVCIARNICRMEKGKEPIPQGTKGLLPPPAKTLHGISSQGGIGKSKFNTSILAKSV
jgi:NADH dehydrogenase FAD-containing subunit